tara:strand:+ start:171 stop:767 length:597 start_codon:yes stop_codon:yes gene_type:complete
MFAYTQSLIKDAIEQIPSIWGGSPMDGIQNLTCDQSGKLGERLLLKICDASGIVHEYNGDRNSSTTDNGNVYDVLMDVGGRRFRIEVKTARLSSTGYNFQHESLRNDQGSDFWIFFDVEPDKIHVIVLKDFDLSDPEKHPILGRKPHLRKGCTNTYKLDVSVPTLRNAREAGISMTFSNDDPETLKQVGSFITDVITR